VLFFTPEILFPAETLQDEHLDGKDTHFSPYFQTFHVFFCPFSAKNHYNLLHKGSFFVFLQP